LGQEQRQKLTEAERGVLALLKEEPLTIKQISRRRKTTRQATERLIKSMVKKGFVRHIGTLVVAYTYGGWGIPENATISYKGEHMVRLHGEAYRIEPIATSPAWERVKVSTSIIFQGNTVVAYRDCLMVFSLQSFEGRTTDDCDAVAVRYWLGYFHGLERRYGFSILKERAQNIKRVRAHYAEKDNELARDLRRKKQRKVRVFGTRDSKEWLLFDDSLKLDEAETTHSPTPKDERTAKEDMGVVIQPIFNDYRDNWNKILLPSVQSDIIRAGFGEQHSVNKETSENIVKLTALAQQQSTMMAQILQALAIQTGQQVQPPPEELKGKKKPDYFG